LNAYADTSLLVSLYSPDTNSARAASQIQHLNPTVLLTPLSELELANDLELRVFRREVTVREIRAAPARMREHLESVLFSLQAMPMAVYEGARQVARRRSAPRASGPWISTPGLSAASSRGYVFDVRSPPADLAQAEGLRTP